MGGRGAFENSGGGGISVEYREYSTIDVLNRIKIVQWDKGKNNATPTFSNTKNTTYYSLSKERHKIENIYYYRDHRLVKSVDFKDNSKPHTHYWKGSRSIGRKAHDHNNVFTMNDRDTRLFNAAIKWNNEHRK